MGMEVGVEMVVVEMVVVVLDQLGLGVVEREGHDAAELLPQSHSKTHRSLLMNLNHLKVSVMHDACLEQVP